jgi:hypothetical protein
LSVTAPISAGKITLQDTKALVGLRNGARSDNAKMEQKGRRKNLSEQHDTNL